ncbi:MULTISPECIES: hypothetical protein [unclassified Microcoleus]
MRLAEPLPVTAVHNCVISRQADRRDAGQVNERRLQVMQQSS